MSIRYQYEFKTYKTGTQKGETYYLKRSVKKGKVGKVIERGSSKTRLGKAKKAHGAQVRRQETAIRETKFADYAVTYGGNVNDIREAYQRRLAREIRDERKRVKGLRKEGRKPLGSKRSTLQARALGYAESHIGYVTIWRYYFIVNELKNGEWITYRWASDSGYQDGNHFNHFVRIVEKKINEMQNKESETFFVKVPPSGGCVRLIDRETDILLQAEGFEFGVGCHDY